MDINKRDAARYADIFAALGSRPRLEIMRLLFAAHPNGLTVGELQSQLRIPNSTLSHHLEKLRVEGLVRSRRDRQFLWYSAHAETVEELLSFLYNGCSLSNLTLLSNMASFTTTQLQISNPIHPGDHFAITFAPLSLEEVYALANDPANGAVVVMSGMVRNNTNGKPVVALEYQAYEPMALRVFQHIAAEIRNTWSDVTHVVIHHRIGKLHIGEISVLVAIGCPHRTEAFAACKYAIDTLKHNAPIWKKEHWEDGSTCWVSIGACEQSQEC